jgi:hypothetical protein
MNGAFMTRIEIKIKGPSGWYALIDRKIDFEASDHSIALLVLEYLNDKILTSVASSSFRTLSKEDLQSKLSALGYTIESWRIKDEQR